MVTFLISQWSTSDLTGFLESGIRRREQGCENSLPVRAVWLWLGLYLRASLGHPPLCHNLHLLFACSPQSHPRCEPGVFWDLPWACVQSWTLTLPSPFPPKPLLPREPSSSAFCLPWCWICLPPSPFTVPCPDGHGQFVFNSLNSHYTLPENFPSAWEWIEAKIGLCTRLSGQYQANEHVESE